MRIFPQKNIEGTTKIVQMSAYKNVISSEKIQQEWIEIQAAQSNPARFRTLYERYYEPIFKYVIRRSGDEHSAADICAQIFLKAMQKLPSYKFKGVPFSAWLYRIASNEVMLHFRSNKKTRTVSIDETNLHNLIDEVSNHVDYEVIRAAMMASINDLKEAHLQMIELRFFEQRSFKEIADIINITEANAKVRTYRILERLKKMILKRVQIN